MDALVYRDLAPDEAHLLGTIDRSERIDGTYRMADGLLEFDEKREDVPSWSGVYLAGYVARLRTLIDSGGRALAAWDASRLVGVGSLDVFGVGGDPAVMKLDMLYVSANHRGRGIGRTLTEKIAKLARSLGARALYISATPTRGTVDAYVRMGARVLATPDPEMLAREPEDIHLALCLG